MRALSLFSGAGGDSLGMEYASIKVRKYIELVDIFCETHNTNLTKCKLIGKDITKIEDCVFEKCKNKIQMIFAGFPCQGFSNGGKKDPSDKRNNLFYNFVRAAELIEPEYIIGENVKGLLNRKTPDGKLFINIIKDEFEKIGYKITYKVLKTEDFGIPQTRERLIILGHKEKELTFPEPIGDIKPNLMDIITFSMKGAMKINKNDFDFDTIPKKCILTDLDNDENEDTENIHPYLKLKVESKDIEYKWKVKGETKSKNTPKTSKFWKTRFTNTL